MIMKDTKLNSKTAPPEKVVRIYRDEALHSLLIAEMKQ